MDTFASFDDLELSYLDAGEGAPVVLLHGFAADHFSNWVATGVVDRLIGARRRVIAPDARGHGASAKPHDPDAYANDAMVRDVRSLFDHLSLHRVDVVGYSMGSIVAGRLAPREPRVRSLVLGGVGVPGASSDHSTPSPSPRPSRPMIRTRLRARSRRPFGASPIVREPTDSR
jgi:pimeloyl-ACP methyl ester carboxylesterase